MKNCRPKAEKFRLKHKINTLLKKQAFVKLYYNIRNSEYVIINLIFAVLILLIFIYSLIFVTRDVYFIKSSCIEINDQICISRGLSRAFSQILLGNFEEAKKLNPYSLLVFFFLFIQLTLRGILSVAYNIYKNKVIIRIDILLSLLLFIYCFKSFLQTFFETIYFIL